MSNKIGDYNNALTKRNWIGQGAVKAVPEFKNIINGGK